MGQPKEPVRRTPEKAVKRSTGLVRSESHEVGLKVLGEPGDLPMRGPLSQVELQFVRRDSGIRQVMPQEVRGIFGIISSRGSLPVAALQAVDHVSLRSRRPEGPGRPGSQLGAFGQVGAYEDRAQGRNGLGHRATGRGLKCRRAFGPMKPPAALP